MGKPLHSASSAFRKTPLSVHIASILALLALSASPCALARETINYDGKDTSLLDSNGNLYPQTSFTDNIVTVSGGTVSWDVYGGKSDSGAATGNTATINQINYIGDVYGGYSSVPKDNKLVASSNKVFFKNSSTSNYLVGGHTVIDTSDEIKNGVNFNASENRLEIENAQTKGNLYGSYITAHTRKDNAANIVANDNQVSLVGTTKHESKIMGAYVFSHAGTSYSQLGATFTNASTTDVSGNKVFVSDSVSVTGEIAGGSANVGVGNDSNKTINRNMTVKANNNIIDISGNASVNSLSAGSVFTYANGMLANDTSDLQASHNVINLSKNASVSGRITGGYVNSMVAGISDPAKYKTNLNATHNVINIRDNVQLSDTNSILFGGSYMESTTIHTVGNVDVFTGNTLNLNNWQGSAKNIANFQTVNIDAPVVQNNSVILALTDTAGTQLGNGKTGDNEVKTAVNLNSVAGGSVLNKGDRIHLIQNTAGISGVNANDGQIKQGISALYDIQYVQDDKNVDALILKGKAQDENKVLNEGRVASLAFLNSGADLITRENLRGKYVFGAIEGGHSHYDTGSSVDVDGVNLIVGANNVWQFASGDAQAGVFIEAGWGDTSTSNSIGGNHLNGNGNTHYYGAGLLGRYDWTNGAAKGMYVDGSLRAGRLSNDYSNKDLTDAQGHRASFDVDSTYYGAQAGIGYLWDITPSYQLDMNARYTWTHVDSESANIAGDTFNFDSMDSHRTRLGARLNYTANPQFTPYAGLAWEYEFNGDAKGSVLGYSMDEASLGGSTGIVELGVQFMPSPKSNLTINAGVTGYFGQREGVAGNFRMNYAF